MNTIDTCNSDEIKFAVLTRYLPWFLPLLLMFSRSLADITVLSVGLVFLLRSYQLNNWAWIRHTWFKLNILFWLYLLCINAPLSINFQESLLHSIFYIRWPLFAAALAYWLLNNVKRQQALLISLFCICAFIIFDTYLQYVTSFDIFGHAKASPTRLTGPYTRPIPGIMMLRVLFIAMFMAVLLPQLSSIKRRITYTLTLICIGLVFIFITGERMALILFFTGSIVVLTGLLIEQTVHKSKILIGFLFSVSLFIALLILNPETAERSVYSIFSKLTHFADSDYGLVFQAAITAWQKNPIFGSGFHTYKTVCEEMGLLIQSGIQCSHPHNLYLQIGAESGLVGLILFAIMVGSIYFKALYKHLRYKEWFIASLIFTVLSVSFWPLIGGISILNNGVAALVWLGVGWVLAMCQQKI